MKRKRVFAALAMLALLLSACSAAAVSEPSSAQTAAVSGDDAVASREGLIFPIGMEVPFNGKGYLAPMIANEEVYNFPQTNNVTFGPGARSDWHTHGGMVILVTGGVGYYQEEGKPAQIIRQGDVLEIAPGVKHWHGGSAGSTFAHISVNTNPERPGVEWFDRISDVEYSQLEAGGFTDIPEGAYYAEAANWCREQGILTGTVFNGNTPMTRATVADALYRAEGSPAVQGSAGFSDISAGSAYANAASWASASGVMSGYADGRFGGSDAVTRQRRRGLRR